MTEEQTSQPKKRGRPAGQPRNAPACELAELAKYPEAGKRFVWGSEPIHGGAKRKGLAILYNPAHEGGQVTLMPVTTDTEGNIRWRYRFIAGPQPYRYDKIDIHPAMAAGLPAELRRLADLLEAGTTDWFGGPAGAVKKEEAYHDAIKQDHLSERIKKLNVF